MIINSKIYMKSIWHVPLLLIIMLYGSCLLTIAQSQTTTCKQYLLYLDSLYLTAHDKCKNIVIQSKHKYFHIYFTLVRVLMIWGILSPVSTTHQILIQQSNYNSHLTKQPSQDLWAFASLISVLPMILICGDVVILISRFCD